METKMQIIQIQGTSHNEDTNTSTGDVS